MRTLISCALLVLLVPLAACGERRIVAGDLEAKLRTSLAHRSGMRVRSVACPDDVKVSEGTRFDCTGVRPDGRRAVVEVRLTNDEGGLSYVVRGRGGG
jgi:hypothetical protein